MTSQGWERGDGRGQRGHISRRRLVGAGVAGAVGLGLTPLPVGRAARSGAAQEAPACPEGEVSLSYGFWDVAQQPGIEAQIAAFNEEFPNIRISPEVVPFDDYWTKLQTGVGGGQTYDVFWMNATNFPVFAAQGALAPMTEMTAAGGVEIGAYPESLVQLYTFDGVLHGIPRDFDTIALAYNKELFDAAGVAYPTAEWTWDDVRAAAEQLTVKDGDQVSQWGFGSSLSDQQNYFNFIVQNGGGLLNEDGTQALVGEPPACEAFAFLADLVANDLSPDAAVQQANEPYDTLFPAGVIAMIPSGSWNMRTFHEANPAIDVAPLPQRKQRASIIHGLANVVYAQGPNQCAAMEWVKFLGSERAEQILADSATVIPAMNGLQEAWLGSIPEMNLQVFLDAVAYSVPFPTTPKGPEWRARIEEVVIAGWNGEIPADQICTRAAEAANAALAAS